MVDSETDLSSASAASKKSLMASRGYRRGLMRRGICPLAAISERTGCAARRWDAFSRSDRLISNIPKAACPACRISSVNQGLGGGADGDQARPDARNQGSRKRANINAWLTGVPSEQSLSSLRRSARRKGVKFSASFLNAGS